MKFHTELECRGFGLDMWKQRCLFERIHLLQLLCEMRLKPYVPL